MSTKKQVRARARADDINTRLEQLNENLEVIPVLVTEAYEDGDWETLGYPTWEDYITKEFGTPLIKLQRHVREDWCRQLSNVGMSTREIAPVVNVHDTTVLNDLRAGNSAGRSTSSRNPLGALSEPIRTDDELKQLTKEWKQKHPADPFPFDPLADVRDWFGTVNRSLEYLVSVITPASKADLIELVCEAEQFICDIKRKAGIK